MSSSSPEQLSPERRGAMQALCETIVPGSRRVEPVVYVEALLARMPEADREAMLTAIDSLAEVASGGPEALRERTSTPEFMMVRALAVEAYYSDFVAPGAPGPGAWEEIDFNSPLATRLEKDWFYLGVDA
jgi:hypothetical protein